MKKWLRQKYIEKRERGFTILETMVAIFILIISITGPMVFAQSGLRTAFVARDQITGFYLAQDAIETIKNVRDQNALDGDDWLDDIIPAGCGDPCVIQVETTNTEPEITECSGGVCDLLNINSDGFFTYEGTPGDAQGTEESRFRRTITVAETSDDIEAQIVVAVEWTSNVQVGNSRVLVQENIFNWIPAVQ